MFLPLSASVAGGGLLTGMEITNWSKEFLFLVFIVLSRLWDFSLLIHFQKRVNSIPH